MIKTDLGWTDYILGKLDKKKEIFEGNPTCAGLSRIFEAEFGKILSKEIMVADAPNLTPGVDEGEVSSTVVCSITFVEYPIIQGENEELHYQHQFPIEANPKDLLPVTVQAGVDSRAGLLPEPFNNHLVSSLDTRAFSRALKQAMCLNCMTSDEMQSSDQLKTIAPIKIEAISNLCKELKINPDAFLTVEAACTMDELKNLSNDNGVELIEKLKSYQDKKSRIPKEIKV